MEQASQDMCPNCFTHHYNHGQCQRCGYQMSSDSHRNDRILQAGTLLRHRYCVGKVLGEGGFGITYKAYDTKRNRICAVKEYAPNGQCRRAADKRSLEIASSNFNKPYAAGLKRFMEESQILMKLDNIPSVVNILESFQENATAYFVMEYLDGADLGQIVRTAENRLPVGEVTNIILQVALSMDVIHTKTKIIHRDISPDNIYITKDKKVKLIDFGSAKVVTGDQEGFSVLVRLRLSPPEQYASNMAQGSYTDVYSLAATYYYALTKTNLPPAPDRLNGQNYVPLKQLGLGIADRVSDAVDRALCLDVRMRTQTMQAFIQGIIPAGSEPGGGLQTFGGRREGQKPRPSGRFKLDAPPHAAGAVAPAAQGAEKNAAGSDTAGQAKTDTPYICVLSGPLAGKSWLLPPDRRIKVGRAATGVDVRLEQPNDISRIHCEITYLPVKKLFTIRDLSTYGVFYNGQRLEKGREYHFSPPVRFVLASRNCMIEVGVKDEYH